jgi:putative selenium metabolism hydrolase
MTSLEMYLNNLDCKPRKIFTFLEKIVRTPSLSGEEEQVARIIFDELETLGYAVDVDEMGNLIASRGSENGKTILFDGHLDHIQPGSLEAWTKGPYSAEIENDIMYGRATVDMKGAIAAMIYGCAEPEIEGKLILTFVVHEETNEGVATKKIIEERSLKPDACILGEPTDLNVSIGQRGRSVFKIVTRGVTSHASMPEMGVNALYKMNPIIERIKKANESLPNHPFLGSGSMSVTSIISKPGSGPIVPDYCEIQVDRRLVPQESLEVVLSEMEGYAPDAEVSLLVDRFKCYTDYETASEQYFPGWITDRDHWLVKEGVNSLEMGMSKKPDIIGWKFSTDGIATSGQLGIPTIGFGPGDPSLAHQPDEKIALSDVMSAARGYCALAAILTA